MRSLAGSNVVLTLVAAAPSPRRSSSLLTMGFSSASTGCRVTSGICTSTTFAVSLQQRSESVFTRPHLLTRILVPFIVRGPGIPANVTESAIVLNIDVAPTLVDIASSVNSTQPTDMDGMSFSRFLWPTVADGDDDLASWRTDFLISYHGQSGPCGLQNCPPPPPPHFHENDGRNNTYNCVRALSAEDNSQYCKFVDSENFIEHYDMVADPWQLHNKKGPDAAKEARLAAFRACSGSSCHSL